MQNICKTYYLIVNLDYITQNKFSLKKKVALMGHCVTALLNLISRDKVLSLKIKENTLLQEDVIIIIEFYSFRVYFFYIK